MAALAIYLAGCVAVLLWRGWECRGTFESDLLDAALSAALWPAAVILALGWAVGSYFPRRGD